MCRHEAFLHHFIIVGFRNTLVIYANGMLNVGVTIVTIIVTSLNATTLSERKRGQDALTIKPMNLYAFYSTC